MSNELTGALLGNGEPIVKFENVGDKVKGTILAVDRVQQRDLEGNPKAWDNGDPRMQFVFKLQTEQRDPDVADDDGTRRLFTKYSMEQAIAAALRTEGVTASDSLIGGTLVVLFSGEKAAEKKGYSPTKLFEAAFKKPVGNAAANLLGDDGDSTPEANTSTASKASLTADDIA